MIVRSLIAFLSIALVAPIALATEPVEVDYMVNCQGCHLPDGSGFPMRQVPDLRGQMGKFLRVEGGREFLIRVPGAAQSDLASPQLTNLINWMLNRFSPDEIPPDHKPYTTDEVERLRQSPLIDVKTIRADLVARIVQQEGEE